MKIGIIGHGNVGGALAKRWAAKGHAVIIGTRKAQDEKADALAKHANITVAPMAEAIKEAEVVLVATPAKAAEEIAKTIGAATGKVLIDATNSVGQPTTAYDVFKKHTQAELVKCFNTTGFENMADPNYGEVAADMFMAGDSAEAKEVARQLALDCGFAACYDFGGDTQVKALEHLAFAWINLAIFQKQGRNMAFKVLRR